MRPSSISSAVVLAFAAGCSAVFPTESSVDGPATAIFNWTGRDASGIALNVQTGVGSIEIRPSDGTEATIVATAHTTRSGASLDDVAVSIEHSTGSVTVCSLYLGARSCAAAGDGGKAHIVVDYVVNVPVGQTLRLATGVGDIRVRDADGELMAATGVGSIDVSLKRRPMHDLNVAAGTGSVTFTLPSDFVGRVDAATGVGRVITDFPLTTIGVVVTGSIHGTIGSGGPSIKAATGVGDITLRRQ
jgi:hypothetical protein